MNNSTDTKDNIRAMTGTKHKVDIRPVMDEDNHVIDGNRHVTDGNRQTMDGNRHGMDARHVKEVNRLSTATKHKDGKDKHTTNGVHIPSGVYEDKNIS